MLPQKIIVTSSISEQEQLIKVVHLSMWTLVLFMFTICTLNGQINTSFDGTTDLEQLGWSGDLTLFEVNSDQQLQLQGDGFSEASVFHTIEIQDSMKWQFYTNLDFAPSTSNRLRINLIIDSIDLATANGIVMEIGQSGSEDIIRLIQLSGGQEMVLGESTDGHFGDGFEGQFEIVLDASSTLTINSITSDGIKRDELNIALAPIAIEVGYFGFSCHYTSSRADLFFFDDIIVDVPLPDTLGPTLLSSTLLERDVIHLVFDEPLNEISVRDISNYNFSEPTLISEIDMISDSEVLLILDSPLLSGTTTLLSLSGISDTSGNLIDATSTELIPVETPDIGDLLINEILFNPPTGGADYIEIYNNSDKFLDLTEVSIENSDKDQSEFITSRSVLKPGEYLALTEDVDFVTNYYPLPNEVIIEDNDLPSFNSDEGNISIVLDRIMNEVVLESFDYSENLHFDLLSSSDRKGVSLERISFESSAADDSNWFSASTDTRYGTPGYVNSQASLGNNMEFTGVNLRNRVFSPDQDGRDDQLIIEYQLPHAGYVLNIEIYDQEGRWKRDLVTSVLLGEQGVITWDGLIDGNIAPIGLYIIRSLLHNPDGNVIDDKQVAVVAENLD